MHAKRLAILGGIFILSCVLFMTLHARGNWDFVLMFRGKKLAALLVVAAAISTSTLLFQTISGNRILTPSIMGFDTLYVLLQSVLVLTLGGFGYAQLDPSAKFFAELTLMLFAALALFGTLLGKSKQDINRLILTGVILGVLFRSLTSFVQRLIDPNEFAIIQVSSFARFNWVELDLLTISSVIIVALSATLWRFRGTFDVMELGRDNAINLGVSYDKMVILILVSVAALVSVSTALVGPVVFFGLLVTSVTRELIPTHRHAILIPAAAIVGGIILVLGQTILERVLGLETTIGVVVDFLGGLVFLMLILKGQKS